MWRLQHRLTLLHLIRYSATSVASVTQVGDSYPPERIS